MTALEILAELHARGAVAYRRGGNVHVRPPEAITPELLECVKAHKADLLPILPDAPPAIAPAPSVRDEPWIVSSDSDGHMWLLVAAPPPWPDDVFEAAALVEVIDRHHRTGADALAHAAALRLETKLAVLRGQGVEAWLTN